MSIQEDYLEKEQLKANENLYFVNLQLWKGINVTNRRLENTVKELRKNTDELLKFSRVQQLLLTTLVAHTQIFKSGFSLFTTQFKDNIYHIGKILAESTFQFINAVQELDRTVKQNTNMLLRALGSEEGWKKGEGILSDKLIAALNEFKGDEEKWIKFINDPKWAEAFFQTVKDEARKTFDATYNWAWKLGSVFKEQIGYIMDKTVEWRKSTIDFFEKQKDIQGMMHKNFPLVLDKMYQSVNKLIAGLGTGGGGAGAGAGEAEKVKETKGVFKEMFKPPKDTIKAFGKSMLNLGHAMEKSKQMEWGTALLTPFMLPMDAFGAMFTMFSGMFYGLTGPLTIVIADVLGPIFEDAITLIGPAFDAMGDLITENQIGTVTGAIMGGILGALVGHPLLGLLGGALLGGLAEEFPVAALSTTAGAILGGITGAITGNAALGLLVGTLMGAITGAIGEATDTQFGSLAGGIIGGIAGAILGGPAGMAIGQLAGALIGALTEAVIETDAYKDAKGILPDEVISDLEKLKEFYDMGIDVPTKEYFDYLVELQRLGAQLPNYPGGGYMQGPLPGFQHGGEVPYTGLYNLHQNETVHQEGVDRDILEAIQSLSLTMGKIVQKLKWEHERR